MFWFSIWVPKIEQEDWIAYLSIDGFCWQWSWPTRNDFIDAWVKDAIEWVTWNGRYNEVIEYRIIKENLENIRYTSKCRVTWELWINDYINNAIKKFWEENLYCLFD